MGGIAGILHLCGGPPEADEVARMAGAAGSELRAPEQRALAVVRGEQAERGELAVVVDGEAVVGGAAGLAAAWERDGQGALSGAGRSLAAAVWDRAAGTLTLARDAFGLRPLYWARSGDRVAFASELPALLALSWVSREVAVENMAEYLSFRYVHAPRTLLRDVREVPPGHVVRLDSQGERISRWWEARWAPPGSPAPPESEVVPRVDTALQEAVTRRLTGGGRVGLLLSGGLDSSAILYAARAAGAPPTFTVALDGDPVDESPFAARVARVMGAEHHLVRVDSRALVDAVDRLSAAMGHPLPTAAAVLQGLLYREGALSRAQLVYGLPGPLRLLGRRAARAAHREHLAAAPSRFGLDLLIGGSSVFDVAGLVALLRDPALVRPGVRRTILEPLYSEVDSDPINEILHVWQRGWLAEDSLARSGRMAAWAGVEVRYPLLDDRFAALCAALPGEAKVRRQGLSFITKWPLRRAMAGRLPDRLLNRPKRALPAPLHAWLRGDGEGFLRERLETLVEDGDGLFLPDAVRRIASEHLTGARNNGLKLWTLLLFSAWRRSLR